MSSELLKFCLEKGLLLDKEILNLFSEVNDMDSLKLIIEKIKSQTQKRIITKDLFSENKEEVNKFFLDLPKENQNNLKKLKIKLGLSIEISKEINSEFSLPQKNILLKDDLSKSFGNVKILSNHNVTSKKIEVKDFVNHFRNRFNDMKQFLQEHPKLNNLVSINKIFGNKQNISLIGIISSKKITKNKNILFEIEDLTGKIKILINKDKLELYKKAEEIMLDSVIGFKGSGNKDIFFVNDIVFPEASLLERKKSPSDEMALFIGDLHFGSKRFLKKSFLKFIDYLNGKFSKDDEFKKIKYLFIVGDLITGIGNYPNQEKDLEVVDLEEQFLCLAELLGKIRRDIKIIISPGNHDCVRLMEPQPLLDEKYAWPLYNLKNVILTENPAELNIGAKRDFQGFNVLTYHGFSFPFHNNSIPKLMISKAMNSPEEIMKYLLKNRHLAPTHAAVQSFPSLKDTHIIKNVPDIFVGAHSHKSAVSYSNNILIISSSSWEGKTAYQEKFGNEPDHCKVPMFNLKTREIKILDFEEEED